MATGPKRIRVERALPAEAHGGYRDAAGPIGPQLRISFSAFAWWDLFMAVLTVGSLGAGSSLLGTWGVVAAGLVFSYLAIAIFVNRAEITLDRGTLRSRLGPVPIFPPKALDASKIRHVIATQQTSSGGWSESTNVSWYVVAILEGDLDRVVSRHLRSHEEAAFVARTLEAALGLAPSDGLDGVRWEDSD